MSLLVLGTVALDDVKTPCGIRNNMLGGSASHFSMAARLFTKVNLVAIVGSDFPKKYFRFFEDKGIDVSSLHRAEGKTFHWEGEYKKEDLNKALTIATEIGVLTTNFIPRITDAQRRIPYVFLANIDPEIQLELLRLVRTQKLVGVDSMNLWINIKRKPLEKLLKKVDLFVANDGEARLLSGENNLIRAAKYLRNMGPKFVVVKKGEHGVLFFSDRFMFSFPAYPIERVVDPTGAGDTFAGGLMGYLAKAGRINEMAFKRAVLYATTIASFNVQGFGVTKTENLTMPVVNGRLKELIKFIS
ncbi:MAG TPA: PfkB family carbohydrate kinase [Candidatus Omnitrophota bacterium]|nr:PfkB family carbohydrate kinase [Candidatus Omnitrophota bacterium]HPD84474.1 PfkB family carbohydrate kinase [Candidatus Omnitrophota bacterium]HRZ03332.1 PfkB family carbohydrate kinase [Candidatus Omnitrophota bacterium]